MVRGGFSTGQQDPRIRSDVVSWGLKLWAAGLFPALSHCAWVSSLHTLASASPYARWKNDVQVYNVIMVIQFSSCYSIQHGIQVHIIPIQVAIWNLPVPLSPSFSFGGRLAHLR